MSLPQELRDKVYQGLLCRHIDGTRHREHEKIWDDGLEPAILRACKQVCEEASRVLYSKNGTALIRMDAQAYGIFRMARSTGLPRFPEIYPIARVECDEIGGVPGLEMEISVLPQDGGKDLVADKQIVFIGFLPALPKMCKFITSCSSTAELQLVVHMEKPIGRSIENRQQMLSDCFESFCEVRGLGRAVLFTDSQHNATAAKIVDLMTKPVKAVEDFVSRTHAHEARILRQMEETRWNDARDTLDNALDEFCWLDHFRALRLVSLAGEGIHKVETMMINMRWNHVTCCLEVGRTGDVRHEICQMFQYWPPQKRSQAVQEGYWDRVADAHYAIGKAYMIDGAPDLAVYSFLQALQTAPGHVETDKAVDHLEERVKSSLNPEDVMAMTFIEYVLKEVRHQAPGYQSLTEDQEKKLAPGFQATYMEIQGLLCDLVVTGLSNTSAMASLRCPAVSHDRRLRP